MSRLSVSFAGLALILLTTVPALADQPSENAKWAAADRCARDAFQKFPDYTPESNAARENYRRACMRANNLPTPNGQAGTSN
ncbi:MAG: hypothetical protein KGL11_13905 [Alphaproteobacteria bacterium]|nr:hypothetical protein [Alphaproteobacteria bacterium]